MKKLIPLVLVLFFFWGNAIAQDNKITITDFYHNEKDRTAITAGTIVLDSEGEKCALIKVMTNLEGFVFDVGALGVRKTVQKIGEIWVYVPYGSKKLKISHPTLATLQYEFPTGPAKKGATYIMQLHANEVFDQVVEDDTKIGKLNFNIYPKDAHVIINAVPVMLDTAGRGEVNLYYGRYTYKITDENHYPYVGRIKIDGQKAETLKIRLKQAYGWLQLANNEGIKDAAVFIDETLVDSTTNKERIPVKHGNHSLRIENPLYHSYTSAFSIEDSTVTNMQISLQPNYGTVKLIANDPLSTIYIDNVAKGKGSWSGKVSTGIHIFECRRGAHEPSSKTINIGNGTNITIPLDAPAPIYGAIDIKTSPDGAKVYINDTLTGTTPLFRNDILIGEKQVRIEKEFYTTENRDIIVSQNSTSSLSVAMTNIVPVTITSNIDSANLYLNGTHIGHTPFADTLNGGKYALRLYAGKKYRTINDIIEISPDNNSFNYNFKKDYARANELYLDFYCMIPTHFQSYARNFVQGVNFGTFVNNINLELGMEYTSLYNAYFYVAIPNKSSNYSVWMNNVLGFSGQAGYGIALSNRFRMTPQIGIHFNSSKIEGSEVETYENHFRGRAYSFSGIASCRMTFAFLPFMGLSITPSCKVPIKASTSYKFGSESIDTINNSWKGFSIKAGIVLFI